MVKQGNELTALMEEVNFPKALRIILMTFCHGDHYVHLLEMSRYFSKPQQLATAGDVKHIDNEVDAEAIKISMASTFPNSA